MWKNIRKKSLPIFFIGPFLVLLFLFRILPIGINFYISFCKWEIMGKPQFVGFQNYFKFLFNDNLFIISLLNTFFYVSSDNGIVFTEKYGSRKFKYSGLADVGCAKSLAANIKKLPAIKEELADIFLVDIVSVIHEYTQNRDTSVFVEDISLST